MMADVDKQRLSVGLKCLDGEGVKWNKWGHLRAILNVKMLHLLSHEISVGLGVVRQFIESVPKSFSLCLDCSVVDSNLLGEVL